MFVARSLHMFIAVAEELHFGRAAARLHMTQPPLSQQIRDLEIRLDAELFVRTTRDVRLTAAGKLLLERARRLCADSKSAEFAVRQAGLGKVGSLALGFVNSAVYDLLPKVIAHYRTELPEVDLEMREMTSGDLVEAILAGRIDVALMRASSAMKDSGLEFSTIWREPMLLALPHAHPLAKLQRVPARNLDGLDFVQFSSSRSPYFREINDRIFHRARVRPRVVYESLLPTMLSLVEAGMGAALVPAGIAQLLTDRLVYKPLTGVAKDAVATLQCARRRGENNPLVLNFLETVRLLAAQALTAPS